MEGTTRDLRVAGIAGSIREKSLNRALLRAAVELAPSGMRIDTFDGLAEIPPYNQDVDQANPPVPVQALRQFIGDADALLVVTPEYNYSVPGVLKNAIDWASRPRDTSVLRDMPAGIMGAARGAMGSVRAQLHLRQSFIFTYTLVMPRPEIMVTFAADRFDDDLRLRDQQTRSRVAEYLVELGHWTRRLRRV